MTNPPPPVTDETTAETQTADKPQWWRRISRRAAIGASLGGIVVAATGYAIVRGTSHSTHESAPPTDAERFEEWFVALEKSDETEARNEDWILDDLMLNRLTSIDRLTTIHVDIKDVSIETFSQLAKMPHLEQLHLRGQTITDELLAQIAASKTIWLLNLPVTSISPEAIEGLASMPALWQLRLGIQGGDNRHGRAVASLSHLRAVHLIGVAVTDEGLQPLAKMPRLESLYLDDTAVTNTGWVWLFQNNPQLHVHVNQKHHDRDPQKHSSRSPKPAQKPAH